MALMESLGPKLPPPTGTRIEQGKELIKRCDDRDKKLEERAIAAERDGDSECCWMCMAARAENKRVREKIANDVAELEWVEANGKRRTRMDSPLVD